MSKTETCTASDIITLMSALTVALERFPDADEFDDLRRRIIRSSAVIIETPDRGAECWNAERVQEYPDESLAWARGMWHCPCPLCQHAGGRTR